MRLKCAPAKFSRPVGSNEWRLVTPHLLATIPRAYTRTEPRPPLPILQLRRRAPESRLRRDRS